MYPMELASDRQEITLRLLQNGKYVWTISINTQAPVTQEEKTIIAHGLKNMDKSLQDAFPNHVKPGSVGFKSFEE
jgi:hypothetical protein